MSNEAEAVQEVEQFEGFVPEGAPMEEQSVDSFDNMEPIIPQEEEVKEEQKDDDPNHTIAYSVDL